MEAYKGLKGGGQITEIEGAKAQQAIARIGRAQSEKEFKIALQELADIITLEMQRRTEDAGFGGPNQPTEQSTEQLQPDSGGWSIKKAQ